MYTNLKSKAGLSQGKPLLATLAGTANRPPPIWLMRQAGRYLPEYRKLRSEAKNFLNFCFTPDLAVEATLQPIRRYGMDAAILFSDILTVPWALGQQVGFMEGEGPKLEPVRSAADLTRLQPDGAVERLSPVYETVRRVSAALPDKTALIGFAGAPWTVAAYMVEGGGSRDFAIAKTWALSDPEGFGTLISMLVETTVAHLAAQIEAGAETVQLFDSWAGSLAPHEFKRWVITPTKEIVENLRRRCPGVPIIGFPRGAGALLAHYAAETGVDAVGLDTQMPVAEALASLPEGVVGQGNLDPIALVIGGKALADGATRILDAVGDRPFIFNLGHGVTQFTPPEHVAELVELVRNRG